jgi:hypothetical protein
LLALASRWPLLLALARRWPLLLAPTSRRSIPARQFASTSPQSSWTIFGLQPEWSMIRAALKFMIDQSIDHRIFIWPICRLFDITSKYTVFITQKK